MLMASACIAAAAENPTVTLDVESKPIEQAMADLGKQAGVTISCEPGIKADITAHFASMELEKLLDTVTRTNNLKWMKLYIPVEGDEAPRIEQIKARADAVAALTGGPIGVYDPATGKQKLLVEQAPSAPAVDTGKLGLTPVYYIFKPKAEAAAPAAAGAQDPAVRYQALEAERTQLLAQMTPEQQVAAKQQEMAMMLQLTPEARQQMMMAEWKARETMDPAMREQFRQVMRETFQRMRDQGLLPDRGRGDWGGPRDGGRPDSNRTRTESEHRSRRNAN